MDKQTQAYNMIIRGGRLLHEGRINGFEPNPYAVVGMVHFIEKELLWTPVKDFFEVFPPIKRYEDDGAWDYHSTLQYIGEDFGDNFGKNDFQTILMNLTYENEYLAALSIAQLKAMSSIRRKGTGISLAEEFLNKS